MRTIVVLSIAIVLLAGACAGATASLPTERPSSDADVAARDATTALDTEGDGPLSSTNEPEPATATPTWSEPFRLVTLGDAYTAGTGTAVPKRESWPQQLVAAMRTRPRLRLAANLADLGKGSRDVIDEQLWQIDSLSPDLVSLLIGVNDVISPYVSLEDYRRNLGIILDTLLQELPPDRIFVITTPDLTLTARGGDYGPRDETSAAIHDANEVLAQVAGARRITVVDISPVSDRVPLDPTLVAPDGLHPSAKQYAGWVEIIAPAVEQMLLDGQP